MQEIEVLKPIQCSHPVKSSYAKLVNSTGKARNEIEELVSGLKAIGYVNVTTANEIYLIKDGKAYLGIADDVKEKKVIVPTNNEPQEPAKEASQNFTPEFKKKSSLSHTVLKSIDLLEQKINKPALVIEDLGLKMQALTKLAPLLSEDIAELLLEVKSDLERAAA